MFYINLDKHLRSCALLLSSNEPSLMCISWRTVDYIISFVGFNFNFIQIHSD